MMEEKDLFELCHLYTDLKDDEIHALLEMSRLLPAMADLEEADIFIDCPMIGGDALVLAEAKPTKVPSSYKGTVVGLVATKENEPAVSRTFRLGLGTSQMKATTQEQGTTIQTVEPIHRNNRIIGVLIREKRTSEDLELQTKFHLSENGGYSLSGSLSKIRPENDWLTECIDEALLMVNKKGNIVFRNTLAKKLFLRLGYVKDLIGQPYANVRLTSDDPEPQEDDSSYEEVSVGRMVVSIRRVPLENKGMSFAVLLRDITRQKEQEKELIVKAAAIREMHHRIKNSLQTIASLLRLQVRRSNNKEVKHVLSESMMRILSIANTHQLLAREITDDVQLMEVLHALTSNVLRAYASENCRITIKITGDEFKVESDIAIAVALIVNELVQNAFKYAFTEGEEGHIRIRVSRGPQYSRIEVEDDGSGYQVNLNNSDQLGMSIVRSMVKDKLQGTLKVESDPTGTRIAFRFLNHITRSLE